MRLRNGKIDVNVLDRSIDKKIQNASLRAPVKRMSGETVSLRTSRIGELAVYKAANAFSAGGFLPETFRPTILLPEGTQEEELREIMDQICAACSREKLQIEGGYTEVTSAVTRPVVMGSCSASTEFHTKIAVSPVGQDVNLHHIKEQISQVQSENSAEPLQQIVMTKWAGLAGTWLLAADREKALRRKFPESMLARMKVLGSAMSIREEVLFLRKFFSCAQNRTGSRSIALMQHISEGGVFAALWRLSERTGSGFCVDLKTIPILQETIEAANFFDISPYQMDSTGSLLVVTDAAEELVEELREQHIPAAMIGEVTSGNDKLIRNGEEVRYLDRPQPDALLKILG